MIHLPNRKIEHVKANRYVDDDIVHPKEHIYMFEEICGLFRIAGLSRKEVKKKILCLSLEGHALK